MKNFVLLTALATFGSCSLALAGECPTVSDLENKLAALPNVSQAKIENLSLSENDSPGAILCTYSSGVDNDVVVMRLTVTK